VTIRTHVIATKTITVAGNTVIATVPAGHRWVIKFLAFYSAATTPGLSTIFITAPAGVGVIYANPAPTRFVSNVVTPCYAVLDAGDTLSVFVNSVTGGTANVHAGGVDFTL